MYATAPLIGLAVHIGVLVRSNQSINQPTDRSKICDQDWNFHPELDPLALVLLYSTQGVGMRIILDCASCLIIAIVRASGRKLHQNRI